MPLPPRRQEGPTVWQKRTQFPFLFVLTHDVCFSEVRQLLHTLCFQLISIVQNGCDDGHRCWFDYWLHFWLVEHYSVRVMKTREIWPSQTFFNRGGAGPRGALATLSQYMLSSAATFGFFLAIGSVSDALMQRIPSTNHSSCLGHP